MPVPESYLLNLKRNILLEKELIRVISFLRENNIPVIPLKGPALARFLYDDLPLTQGSCDLDFLVKGEDIEKTEGLLKGLGYNSCNEDKTGFLRSLKLRYARQLHFNQEMPYLGNLMLDLHWDLRCSFCEAPLRDFWESASEIRLDGYTAIWPKNEELLIYLCLLTVSMHEFIELKYARHIHALISKFRGGLDWHRIYQLAQKNHLRGSIFYALKIASNFYNTEIPQDFLRRIRPALPRGLILKLWLNKKNILFRKQMVASGYLWRYLVSAYISSENIFDFLRRVYLRIFLRREDVMGMYGCGPNNFSYQVYLKRLFKPLLRRRIY